MAKVMHEVPGSRVDIVRDEDEVINRTKMAVHELREHMKKLVALGYTVSMSVASATGHDGSVFVERVEGFNVMIKKVVTKQYEL